jgi:hypothetical protein
LTDQQPKTAVDTPTWTGSDSLRPALSATERRTSREAIRSGLDFLLAQRKNHRWESVVPAHGSQVRLTACVLARLGELPSKYFIHGQRQQIEESLNWLEHLRTADGGWVCGGYDDGDIEATAWAVIALRLHGRAVPEAALKMIRCCRRPDGGFAAHPGQVFRQSAPETSALAIRALAQTDSAAEGFFASRLQAMDLGACGATSRYMAFSEILDWEPGLASPHLLDKVRNLTPDFGGDSVMSQALLLRCLLRLRNRWAWPLAAALRAVQKEDGSWCELEPAQPAATPAQPNRVDNRILPTTTAVSALVLEEFQPGLYFGSDSPLPPRRLRPEDGVI